ncbi:hypothetical protein GCM10020366_66680 [Saccharopolyspora gregorii]|uniref:Uncharacterized protein n=1 Tax=Saccharopolyspora gregorii TaxID=33914 RepID=A0ABP6S1P5_9PSEU
MLARVRSVVKYLLNGGYRIFRSGSGPEEDGDDGPESGGFGDGHRRAGAVRGTVRAAVRDRG